MNTVTNATLNAAVFSDGILGLHSQRCAMPDGAIDLLSY
jgi:hypothetical protein